MIKNYLSVFYLLIFFIIYGCGYNPLLIGSSYDFSIKVENNLGNEQINNMIENKLQSLDGIKKIFKVSLNSSETKNIISKDSKGDPTILEIVISLKYKLSENGKVLVNRSLTQRSTYDNISDKFELSKSEKILRDTLVENLVSDIINSGSNLILNPMINDN